MEGLADKARAICFTAVCEPEALAIDEGDSDLNIPCLRSRVGNLLDRLANDYLHSRQVIEEQPVRRA